MYKRQAKAVQAFKIDGCSVYSMHILL